ncbi:MAG: hypothetical protein AAF619_09760 [Pseudomonadota bacterium]
MRTQISLISTLWPIIHRFGFPVLCALAFVVSTYTFGRMTGAITVIGAKYQSAEAGFMRFNMAFGGTLPVYLRKGDAIEAVVSTDAARGALALRVRPVGHLLNFGMPWSNMHIEGETNVRVRFVAEDSGWFIPSSAPSVLGGPSCDRGEGIGEFLMSQASCPMYDLAYRVVWHAVGRQKSADIKLAQEIPALDRKNPSVFGRIRNGTTEINRM